MPQLGFDPTRSTVILAGTSTYEPDSGLASYPQIAVTIAKLKTLFSDDRVVGIPRIEAIVDADNARDFLQQVAAAAATATDLLVFYYIGHGLLGDELSNGSLPLYLTAADATKDNADFAGIDIARLNLALKKSTAQKKLCVFECCYAARAIPGLSANSTAIPARLDQLEGAYSIAAAPANQEALPIDDYGYTAFSGALIHVLEHGVATDNDPLTLDGMFDAIVSRIKTINNDPKRTTDSIPIPRKIAAQHIAKLAIARNSAAQSLGASCLLLTIGAPPDDAESKIQRCVSEACRECGYNPLVRPLTWTPIVKRCATLALEPLVLFLCYRDATPDEAFHFLLGCRFMTRLPTIVVMIGGAQSGPVLPVNTVRVAETDDEDAIVQRLTKRIEDAVSSGDREAWRSELPMAEIRISPRDGEPNVFLYASQSAAKLFHHGDADMRLVPVNVVLADLLPFMRSSQRAAFLKEQGELLDRLQTNPEYVVAKKPIWFIGSDELDQLPKHHQDRFNHEFLDGAFLPVIVRFAHRAAYTFNTVLYLDVTKIKEVERLGRSFVRLGCASNGSVEVGCARACCLWAQSYSHHLSWVVSLVLASKYPWPPRGER